MSGREDEFDAQLAERGDDRPGLDDLEPDDYSALGLSDEVGGDDELDEDVDDADDDDEEDEEEEDDEDDDDGDDYPDDALDDEIDSVIAFYREDGRPSAQAMERDLANDLDELVERLRRVPGDAGAAGAVVIDSDFFVLVRVRGKKVEVLLSDVLAAHDWPIARDAADFLGEDVPDDDEDAGPVGDFDMFADSGLTEFDLEQLCADLDAEPDEILGEITRKLGFGPAYAKAVASFEE